MEELKKYLEKEIKNLDRSLKENSWENCDDDEEPDYEIRKRDLATKEAYKNVLKFIENGGK